MLTHGYIQMKLADIGNITRMDLDVAPPWNNAVSGGCLVGKIFGETLL
jgi:hypothetical protein